MSDHKNRRWFQFSLRSAIVATLIAAVAMGAYIRMPYYLAATALDEASGDKSFPAWPVVRDALIYNETFRADSLQGNRYFVGSLWRDQNPDRIKVSIYRDERSLLTRRWDIEAGEKNGTWSTSTP